MRSTSTASLCCEAPSLLGILSLGKGSGVPRGSPVSRDSEPLQFSTIYIELCQTQEEDAGRGAVQHPHHGADVPLLPRQSVRPRSSSQTSTRLFTNGLELQSPAPGHPAPSARCSVNWPLLGQGQLGPLEADFGKVTVTTGRGAGRQRFWTEEADPFIKAE